MTHTKGPWGLNPRAKTNVVAGDRPIASCSGYTSNTDRDSVEDENEDNARLIAAAPELLEACQRLVNHWESSEEFDADQMYDVFDLARYAVSKALGESEAK